MKRVNILNTEIDNLSMTELLENLECGVVFTPNVDHIMKLREDREFREAYNGADCVICDSKILLYSSWFLGTPLREKISGSDFFPAFYNYHKNHEKIKIFLLGAGEGIAQKAQAKINQKVGREIVVGAYSPSYGFEKNESECLKIIEIIQSSGATVLAIGVGAPKQEKWIYKYRKELTNIKIFLAIGATLDFEADNLRRAPRWMSNVGLEWLFRLILEPRRLWKRYLVDDLPFFWLILKQKFTTYLKLRSTLLSDNLRTYQRRS
ncbi:MAG TPA: glycosyltransferase [Cyanobacteria bacterium UBA11372]|nr:glycosyltransferase [Cyanobacteria bacterium UBA11372]